MPKKIKRKAFIASLNAKLKSEKVLAVSEESLDAPKTKEFIKRFKGIGIKGGKVLFLVEKIDRNLHLATRNIKNLTLKKVSDATALDVLSNERIVVAKKAVEHLNRNAQ